MEQKDYRLAAIMYTDIAGFSRMMETDESGTLELLKYHNELIGEIVARHHGTIIKTIGDALLVDFKNTVEAMQSALEIEDKLYLHNKENSGLPLLVRIGLHLGDIYFFENDALGEGINIAARLQSLARPGCICFSQDVYNLVLNKIEFRAEKLGKVSLKNITKEIHAYEITSLNVEFDPDRDKPRSGFKPGSYLGEQGELPVGGMASSSGPGSSKLQAPAASTAPSIAATTPAGAAAPAAAQAPPEPDRDYSEEGSRNVLAEIRRAVLQDIKGMGRRMTVDEALARYGFYGVEADEVIATMADQGLLVRAPRSPLPPTQPEIRFGRVITSEGNFDPHALGRNIEAAVHGIVGEIERSVARGAETGGYAGEWGRHADRYRRRAERHAIKDAFRREVHGEGESGGSEALETSKWDRKLMEDESWKPGEEEISRDFCAYRDLLKQRCRKQRGGFVGNLVSFLAVNGVLWFINMTTSTDFLWAAIVSAAWGIGLVSSTVAATRAGSKLEEIEAMPSLDNTQLEDYKKLNRVRDSIAMHGASAVTVPFLLGLINLMTAGSHPFYWFLIPSAAIVLSFVSHLFSYAITKPRLEKRLLASLGIEGGWRNIFKTGKARKSEASELGPYAELYREAERARRAVIGQLKEGGAGPLDAGLEPSLDEYLGQVRLLAQSANEIDRLVEAIPMNGLEKDKAALVAKESSATSESLRAEYRKSIGEIDRQDNAYQELKEQSEVIRLRLGSSVNQLKQMRLDIARIKAAPGADGAGGTGIDQLKRRTDELSRYLEDLRTSYDEARKDPFAELEEAERAALAAQQEKRPDEGPKQG